MIERLVNEAIKAEEDAKNKDKPYEFKLKVISFLSYWFSLNGMI